MRTQTTTSVGFLVGTGAWSIAFLTLIWGYLFYRLRAGEWLAGYINVPVVSLALLNSGVLLVSSWSLHRFLREKMSGFFVLGLGTGTVFILGQIRVWTLLAREGLTFTGSLAGSFLYLLTGFHVLHVILGMVLLLIFGLRIWPAANDSGESRFAFALKFWDLLTAFWLVLFFLIFIVK